MRALAVALIVLVAALAGCADPNKDADDTPSSSPSASATQSATSTATAAPTPKAASLLANATNGTAPLAVNFTVNATAGALSWSLAFGDGSATNGTSLPAAANHTYSVGGNFSANLTVTYAGGATANATLAINVTLTAQAKAAPPDVLVFEFADSLGCAGEDGAGADACLSFIAGPDAAISGIDGYWQALDERYWGLSFTTTIDQVQPAVNDSDCAFTDADHTIIGFASNGSSPCMGVVPEGTAWIFLFPFAVPALSQTLTFTV